MVKTLCELHHLLGTRPCSIDDNELGLLLNRFSEFIRTEINRLKTRIEEIALILRIIQDFLKTLVLIKTDINDNFRILRIR